MKESDPFDNIPDPFDIEDDFTGEDTWEDNLLNDEEDYGLADDEYNSDRDEDLDEGFDQI